MSSKRPPGKEKRPMQAVADRASHTRLGNKLTAPLGRRIKDAVGAVYKKTVVEVLLRRKNIVASTDGRHIPLALEHEKPLLDTRRGHSYISNSIRTSRYNLWDFFPKQLFFQFSRVGNFYFLCVGVPQMVCNHWAVTRPLISNANDL